MAFLLWVFAIVGAVALLYAVTRLVLANPRLLQLQDGEKNRRHELLLPPLWLATLMLFSAIPAIKNAVPQANLGFSELVFGLSVVACTVLLLEKLFSGLRPRIGVAICSVLVIAAWWLWPSWLTVNAFAVLATCAILSVVLLFGARFRHAVLLALLFMAKDFLGVIATQRTVQNSQAQFAHAHPQPRHFLLPKHWQLDLEYQYVLGVIDVAIPGAMVVVAGVYGYRNGGRWGILAGGLIGYAIGLTAPAVVYQVTRLPQAGLLYICTSVAAGVVLVAWRQGLLRGLWSTSKPAVVAS